MPTFTYVPSFDLTESSEPRVRRFQGGDGLEQRIRMGLNTDPKTWNLEFSNRSDMEANGIAAFLESVGGSNSFDWTPPPRLGGNRLLWSEGFDNGVWNKYNAGPMANATAAPGGSVTADKIFENTTASANHFIMQSSDTKSGQYTLSVYVKAGERNQLELQLAAYINGASSGGGTVFDILNGSIINNFGYGPTFAAPSYSLLNVGNGWFRVGISLNKNYNGRVDCYIQLYKDSLYSYLGTIGSGLFLYGAQLEIGSTPTEYKPTTTSMSGVRDIPGKYVCESWSYTARNANNNTIQAKFRQVFEY